MAGDPGADPGRTAWVIGAHGLLGSAVCRRLQALGRAVRTTAVPWGDTGASADALVGEAEALGGEVEVFWCAGAGVLATSEEGLEAEVAVLEQLLQRWRPAGPGTRGFFLASSAGGVYAGSSGSPFTEHTETAPRSAYGRAKLRMEAVVTEWAQQTGTALLVGRLSTLYGPGQDLSKPQGLVSALCRAQLTRQPMNVYVSLDTRRDFLFVDDAAAMVVAATEQVTDHGVRALKVLASERSTTLGAVLGDLHRITRRRPPIVLGTSARAGFQVRDLRLRSVAWPRTSALARTPLQAGIAATLRSTGTQIVPVLPR